MFAFTYATRPGERGPLNSLNVMHLGTSKSAIGATALLRRNLLIYGLGGMILPFIGIKLIDLVVHNLLGA
jgi:potassium-transporting ATPase ATP-binding subunit